MSTDGRRTPPRRAPLSAARASWRRFGCGLLLTCAATAAAAAPALRIAPGSVARSDVVALGRDLVIEGEAQRDVAVVNGDARVEGRVGGDLVVLGGAVRLGATARIAGDVFAVGGTIDTEAGAEIAGRAVAYPSIGAAWLTLLEGPSLGLSATSRVVLAAKLALLTAWMALAVALLTVSGRGVLATSELVRADAARSFVTGLTAVLAIFLTALALAAFVPGLAGLPLLVLVVLFALLLKLWGMVAVFHALGAWTIRGLGRRRPQPLNAATLGLLMLGTVKLIPWAGTVVWWLATFVGIGVALASKFGRREPWLESNA
jgi:hypothetical protein